MSETILVDCDGVLSDMSTSVFQLAAERASIFDVPRDVDAKGRVPWDYGQRLGWPGCNAAITEAVIKREFCYRMRPYSGSTIFLRSLEQKAGKENVFIVTAPWNGEWAAQRYAWLQDVMGVARDRVLMVPGKHKRLVQGLLIDDSPENLQGREFHDAFLVTRPWNVGAPFICGTFREFVEAFPDRGAL